MAMQTAPLTTDTLYNFLKGSEVVAQDVTFEAFLTADYGEGHYEWFAGYVIKMPGIDERHNALTVFLITFFSAYLELTGGGRVLHDPMLMRPAPDAPARAPDLQVLLPEHLHYIHGNYITGAADLVVEIVSPGSERTDRIAKYAEYERAGVAEYWLIDPRFDDAQFYQRNAAGLYERVPLDANGVYHSAILPRLTLPVDLLWEQALPGVTATLALVQAMLKEEQA